ncbi:MAG: hypothetical protein LiPW15_719 [Parcubacteria group bacterium LiPW_15]|nr:MAG: hypothetical protein LiPW15_719 [Parcubacteria group bacterium LiPW_15]
MGKEKYIPVVSPSGAWPDKPWVRLFKVSAISTENVCEPTVISAVLSGPDLDFIKNQYNPAKMTKKDIIKTERYSTFLFINNYHYTSGKDLSRSD